MQLGTHRGFEIGRDLHILAATDRTHVARARHFRREPHAARAMNAAVHRGFDQHADIFIFDRALVFGIARRIDAEGNRLILQIAFAALIADRAIERMIDEQKLHHAFARLFHHRRFGKHDGRLTIRAGAQIAHCHGTGGRRLWRAALHLDEAHAAIAGDRQTLVVAKARNLDASCLAGLQQRIFRRNVDLDIVDDELGHRKKSSKECRYRPSMSSMRIGMLDAQLICRPPACCSSAPRDPGGSGRACRRSAPAARRQDRGGCWCRASSSSACVPA